MSNFLIQRSIPAWGKNTYVNWAVKPAEKAVVFIHGFNGSSMTTFGDFNLEFRHLDEYTDCDVYFYSYDSLYTQIMNSALDFKDFLNALMTDLPKVVDNSKVKVNRNSGYKEVIIVAHSLGAVVLRLALNRAFDNKLDWVYKCKLILFAPAHMGARKEIGSFLDLPIHLKCLGPLVRYFVVTIGQLLDKELIIAPLRVKCTELVKAKNVRSFTLAKKVVWAEHERVVFNDLFLEEEPDPIQMHKDHVHVCKPDRNFLQPFEIVREILKPTT